MFSVKIKQYSAVKNLIVASCSNCELVSFKIQKFCGNVLKTIFFHLVIYFFDMQLKSIKYHC